MGNEQFDRYAIEATIGEGGMGLVYRAHDPRLGRTVAIKVLRADATPEDAAWLLREARLAAELEHPNVVAVYDSGELDGRPFIVMEYVRGASLRSMALDPTVSLDRKLGWLVEVARALAAAHRRGLVHRDVKPSNVMVREEDDVAKVLDFGIARHVGPTAIEGPTLTGQMVGTPQYMAPEQMRGEPVDGRADQFAWGVLAHALLTGKTPWRATDPQGIAFAVLTQEAQPFRETVPSLGQSVEAVVLRALSKQTSDRFPTTDQLVAALEDATKRSGVDVPDSDATLTSVGGPPADAPTPLPAALRRSRRRAPRWAIAAGAATLALAGVVGVVVRGAAHAPRKADAVVATPAPSSGALTDLKAPASSPEAAALAYRTAMQAYRDGQPSRFRRDLERALAKDPSLAAAHLRLALLLLGETPSGAREHLAKATALRSTLDAHDQELLRAVAPVLQDNPSDYREAEKRLRAALSTFPRDPELTYWLAVVEMYGSDTATPEAFDAALTIDPGFGLAYAGKAEWLTSLGRWPDAASAIQACVTAVPSAGLCVRARAVMARERGDCGALERDARLLVGMDKGDSDAWYLRAEAEQAQGAAPTAVAEAVRKAMARRVGPELHRPLGDYSIGALAGDFAAAETAAREQISAVFGYQALAPHAQAARELVEVLVEEGDVAGSAAAAADFLGHRDAWELDARDEAFAIARDPTPMMLAVSRRAHRIDDATFTRERDAWAAKWRARVSSRYRPVIWAHGWASPAETPAQAQEALAALAQWGGQPPPWNERTRLTADLGRLYALAGNHDEAVAWLHTAATSCTAVERPLAHVQAQYWLGRAAQDAGDRDAACAAFRDVLKAWGRAARSVTASDSKARSAQLHCEP